MRLKNKKALVTGSSRGIGRAIALRLAEEGAELVIHYHKNASEADAVAALIKTNGGIAHVVHADLFYSDQVFKLADEAWSSLGEIDFLINNAGVSSKKHFLDTTPEEIDHFTGVNFKAVALLTQAIAKKMIDAEIDGAIYSITSVNGIRPGAGFSVYGATKGALETLMKGVALELAPHRIKVNTLVVGAVQTEINAQVWKDPEKLETVKDNIPMGRMGQPEEVAAVLCDLLCSGTYLTGTSITIDGGWLLKNGYENPGLYKGHSL